MATVALGCKEDVTAPGHCPDLCPSDSLQVVDTVITGVVAFDTSVRGFTSVSQAPILLLADEDSLMAHPIVRFFPLPQSWIPVATDTSTASIGTIDSVALELRMDARDSTKKNLRLLVYRLPALLDSTVTYASTLPYFADSMLIDSIPISDSLHIANLRRLLPALKVTPSSLDSFVVSVGFALHSDAQTSVVLAATDFTGTPPHLKFFVHGAAPRDTFRTVFDLTPTFDTWVQTPDVQAPPLQTIVVGNQPASRAFLKFQIPSYYVDTANVVRATLQLTLTRPVRGYQGTTFGLEAQPVLRYFGGKSVLISDTSVTGLGTATVGHTGTVEVEMSHVLRVWRGISVDSLPRIITLRMTNEAFEIGQIDAASGGTATAPKMQISFVRPFKFGVP